MSKHVLRRRRGTAAIIAVGALAATALAVISPAQGTITVSSTESGANGPIFRDSTVPIKVEPGGFIYTRTGPVTSGTTAAAAQAAATTAANNTAFTRQSTVTTATVAANNTAAATACLGNVPSGKNDSPNTSVTVSGPGGFSYAATSPVRDLGLSGFSANPQWPFLSPQPAPAAKNYLGGATPSSSTKTVAPWVFSLDLSGKPAGVYTVSTTTISKLQTTVRYKVGSGPTQTVVSGCTSGQPNAGSTPGTYTNTFTTAPVTETTTFEYRPWQEQFVDVFGNGDVKANVIPRENRFTVGGHASGIYAGTPQNTTFYSLPSGSSFLLPSDPSACAADPSTCLPSTAVKVEPGPGVTPRLMIINEPIGKAPEAPNGLVGVFDLDTQAFIALAKVDGSQRVLTSLGTDLDAKLKGVLAQLATAAAAKGIDVNTLLATKVSVSNQQYTTSLSLLNALQIDRSPEGHPNSVYITSDATVQAGLIFGLYLDLVPAVCATKSASNTSADPRFTPNSGYGFTVQKSDVLPAVPVVGPLGLIAGGPLFHITGKFRSGALANTWTSVIGLDTAANAPNGYPVWVEPFLVSGGITSPKTLDYIGTATWSASETNLGTSCLAVDFMLGTGVAVYNNPLSVGLATLLGPLYQPSPAGQQLNAAVGGALQGVVDQAAANPTVASLLNQILGALPV